MTETQKGKAILSPSLAPSNKLFLILAFVLALAGCAINSQRTVTTSNPDARVQELFEHDGCMVYRFSDAGEFIYYVHCKDGTAQTTWEQIRSNGKVAYHIPKQVHTETYKQKNGRVIQPMVQGVGQLSHPVLVVNQKDAQDYYDYMNFQFYNNDLPEASVRFVPNLQSPNPITGVMEPDMALTIPSNPPQILIDSALAVYPPVVFLTEMHEQCHISTDKYHPEFDDHGPNWQKCMLIMAEKGAMAKLW